MTTETPDLVTCAECGHPNVDPDWHQCGTKALPGQSSLLDANVVFGESPAPSTRLERLESAIEHALGVLREAKEAGGGYGFIGSLIRYLEEAREGANGVVGDKGTARA